MSNSIIIVRNGSSIITGLTDGSNLVEVQVSDSEENSVLGNIYLGKVKNIVKNINAAFIEIEEKKMCYLSLAEVKHPIFSNNDHPGKIRVGDEIVVQVTKENSRYKAPMVTSEFNLTGKYVVLVHGRPALGISQKIKDEETRKRLKALVKPYITGEYGFTIRTNAANADEHILEMELARLKEEYRTIVEFGVHWKCFTKLYSTPSPFIWEIRDSYSDEIDEIKTDDPEIYAQIKDYLNAYQPEDIKKLVLYKDTQVSLKTLYSIEDRLQKALHERVWLNSGAYLIIQPTEALTVIDVNTGKAISGKSSTEETFLNVNLEAAAEIGRQIRLRNLSGIIIVDFIDMEIDDNRKHLMSEFSSILSKDRIPTKLVDMTALNLVEITRKKIRKSIYEQLKPVK